MYKICKEMQKLRNWLDKHNIVWRDDSEYSEFWMVRTKFEVRGHEFSVINGVGSYGGCLVGTKNQGLLECMIDGYEPMGWLTARKVENQIKKLVKE